MEDNLCYACEENIVEEGFELCDVCFARFGEGNNKIDGEYSFDIDLELIDYTLYVLFAGVILFIIALVVFVLTGYVESNLLLATSNLLIILLLTGLVLVVLFMLIKSRGLFRKVFTFILLVLVVVNLVRLPVEGYLTDIRDVVRGDYYEVEGEVIDTYIDVKMHSGYRIRMSPTYTQRFTLDNGDEFSMKVSGEEDYVFEEGKIYYIEALPYMRDILDYKEVLNDVGSGK